MEEQTRPRPSVRYAGLRVRAIARAIDGLIFLAPALFLHFFDRFQSPDFLVLFLLLNLLGAGWLLYQVFMHALFGQTLGKMTQRIRVVRTSGWRIGFREALIRSIVDIAIMAIAMIESLLLLCGIMIPFDYARRLAKMWLIAEVLFVVVRKDHRAIHDLIAGTVVVHCGPGHEPPRKKHRPVRSIDIRDGGQYQGAP